MLGALGMLAVQTLGVLAVLKISGLVLLLPGVLLGALMGATFLRPLLWALCAIPAGILLAVAYTPLAVPLANSLVRSDSLGATPADAIVVLSGGVTGDELMGNQSLDRLLHGLSLMKQGRAGALVVSRGMEKVRGKFISDTADVRMVMDLASVSVASTSTYFVDSATSTRDEAERFRSIAWPRAWRKIVLVTSPSHSGRACATFERVGFKVVCSPAEARDISFNSLQTADDRLEAFRLWVYESAGRIRYRYKGWIP